MKKFALALLLAALPALAGSYTITTGAVRDARLERYRAKLNTQTCSYYGLPASCTQTQARRAFCRRANLGDVNNCEGATQVQIYSDIQTMIQDQATSAMFDAWDKQLDLDVSTAFAAVQAGTATAEQKTVVCQALGLAANCLP